MAQSTDNSAGDGEKAEPAAASYDSNAHASRARDSKAIDKNLPMVVAPKLGAGEDEMADETSEPAADSMAPTAAANSSRFLMLAAAVAFAAAFGSFIGSVSGSGMAHFIYPASHAAETVNAADTLRAMKQQLADLSTIKANLDTVSRSTASQFAKIADRLDRMDQHTAAANETTGSIPTVPPAATPGPTAGAAKLTDKVLPDWVVQDVENGRALIESRYGGVFDVGTGSILPGVGRIDSITRQDGQWLVLTARGTITSGR